MISKNSNIKISDKHDTEQKVLSFDQRPVSMEKVQKEMADGWGVINLIYHQNNYVAILEKLDTIKDDKDALYIPARKKIRIKS